jgi:lysophospholipase L1-like esterase
MKPLTRVKKTLGGTWRTLVALFAVGSAAQTARAADDLSVFRTGDRILFQGDSITDGGRWREGDDMNHIMGQDYAYLIAARLGADLPKRNLLFLNRGISGNKVTEIEARWQTDTLNLKPDILSILVGINDTSSVIDRAPKPVTAAHYREIYDALIQRTVAALPKVRLVLCDPFALPGGLKTTAHWPERIADLTLRREIIASLALKWHAPVVHFQKLFDGACKEAPAVYWLWDGIHPTYAGHQLMADEWVRAVTSFYSLP